MTVIAHPRTISASANDLLWKLEEAVITVEADKPRTVYVKYDDEANKRVGAEEVTVTNVTFEQNAATVEVKANANGAELTFTAANGQDAVVKTCEVRGRRNSWTAGRWRRSRPARRASWTTAGVRCV